MNQFRIIEVNDASQFRATQSVTGLPDIHRIHGKRKRLARVDRRIHEESKDNVMLQVHPIRVACLIVRLLQTGGSGRMDRGHGNLWFH